MKGLRTLWLPGADHAGFETQVVYEKKLEKEGRSRFEMTPEELRAEILEFTLANKTFMEGQLKALGASCDWSREKFTLDKDIEKVVYGTFKQLHDDNLLYRGKRIVNWCAKHQTSLSELETEYKEKSDPFYYFKYGPFTIGTARPETKFGDKYVVMHPEDKRYMEYANGQMIELEWINGPITATIIKDEAIDMEFGTGVMTITPWHDEVDFGIAERHELDKEQVIDLRGKLLPIAGEFAGMKIAEARGKIVEKLKEKGLLVKVDEVYKHNVKVCYKCEQTIEPQILPQWFVKMKPLADAVLERIENDEVAFYSDNYKKILVNWLTNITDWNISRQIAWGIPIPIKFCDACDTSYVDIEDTLTTCEHCQGELRKEQDTFDTWFSSGQWPFATLGYPNSEDYRTFYPTQVMETAGDIIFFWVARMLMLGLYRTGQLPFTTVYLHGTVTARDGKKMSKSKGNATSPLELTEKYGTDALRMALIIGNTPGTPTALYEEKIKAYKLFANKIWNITRFILTSNKGVDLHEKPTLTGGSVDIMAQLAELIRDVTLDIENYRFYLAGEKLYHYVWHTFADVILESCKDELKNGTPEKKYEVQWLLNHILTVVLKLLHPFMPFITEEIWSSLPTENKQMLIVEPWPTV